MPTPPVLNVFKIDGTPRHHPIGAHRTNLRNDPGDLAEETAMTTNPPAARKRPWLRAGVGGCLAVTLLTILAGFLWFRVCDEQITNSGQAVEACRHLTVTDPPVVLLGMLTLVLLSTFYAEISGFGITLKNKITEIEQRTTRTERKTDDLQETVGDFAELNLARVVPHLPKPPPDEASATQVPDPRIADLAEQYNTVRWTMPSGRRRTERMTEVDNQLKATLNEATDFDVAGHLAHNDRGVRLAAYACLQQQAKPDLLSTLVDAAASEDKPFGQYCALRALLHQVAVGARLTERDRRVLREMRDRVGTTTDRWRLLSDLLDEDAI
jgi:hypothetical protein